MNTQLCGDGGDGGKCDPCVAVGKAGQGCVDRQAIRADLRAEAVHHLVVNPKPVRPTLVNNLIHDSLLIFSATNFTNFHELFSCEFV